MIPHLIARGYRVNAHRFADSCVNMIEGRPYWRDVGTLDAFWEANLDLVHVTPDLNLYDETWPIWTYQEQLPPAKFVFDDDGRRGTAIDSLVSGGCIVSGALVRRSLLFSRVRVHSYCAVEDSVILGDVDIGRDSVIRRAVIDKHCRLPDGNPHRRGSRRGSPPLPRVRERRHAGHAGHARRAGPPPALTSVPGRAPKCSRIGRRSSAEERDELGERFLRHFLGQEMSGWAMTCRGRRSPRARQSASGSNSRLTTPLLPHNASSGHVTRWSRVGRVVLEVDRRRRAVVLARRVDRGRVAEAAFVFGQRARIEVIACRRTTHRSSGAGSRSGPRRSVAPGRSNG